MAIDKAVDSAVLDAGLKATANAIRGKTGDSALIEWKNADGFKDAVDAIPAGGGSTGGGFPNGMEWTKGGMPGINYNYDAVPRCLTYANGVYVWGSTNINNYLCYSLDMKNGSIIGNVKIGNIKNIIYKNGLWVASGYYGVWYSTDGMTWTASNMQENTNGYGCGVHYIRGKWLYGSSKGIFYSTDGMTYEATSVTSGYVTFFAEFKGVIVAKISGSVMYSYDGISWTGSNIKGAYSYDGYFSDLDDILYYYDSNSKAHYSVDGINWIKNESITGVVYCGTRVHGTYLLGTDTGAYYSQDGINFTQSNLTEKVVCMRYENGIIVARTITSIYYSIDGITWYVTNFTQKGTLEGDLSYINGVWYAGNRSDYSFYESVAWQKG